MLPKIHIQVEKWRKNVEYGVYVSNLGRVRLLKNKEILVPRIDQKGYARVFTERGPRTVHRLVAYTWLGGKRNENFNIDHINGNKRDNRVKNLRWVTIDVNEQYAEFNRIDAVPADKEESPIEEIELFEKELKNEMVRIKLNNTPLTWTELMELSWTGIRPKKKVFLAKLLEAINNNQPYGGYNFTLERNNV